MNESDTKRFRDRLIEMRTRLTDEFDQLAEDVSQEAHAPGDLSRVPTHPADHDTEGLHERISVAKTESEILNHVNLALQRIDDGTFGQCQDCGKSVKRERLDALPYTPYCVTCERKHEQQA